MRLHVLALAALAAGCSDPETGPEVPRVPAEGDAITFQKILDGEMSREAGLVQIAQSGGFPIETSEGFIFALEDVGVGPYGLSSPNGRFASTTTRTDQGLSWIIVPVAVPEGAEFAWTSKYGDGVVDPLNRHVTYVYPRQIQLVRPAGPHLERWPGVGDAKVAPRTVRVWVPADPPTHLMYAHDGQNLFDLVQPFGSWRLQEAAGPSTLVVGVDNGPARVAEYTAVEDLGGQGGKGDDYADFMEVTVRPFVESRYGTPPRVGVMGASLGGVIAYHQALRRPGVYDFVASLSGTMGWGSISEHNPTPIEQYAALGTCPAATVFYVDSGGTMGSGCADSDSDGIEDDTADSDDNACENLQMKETLDALGCGARVHYVFAPGQAHSETFWRMRSPAIFDLFEDL